MVEMEIHRRDAAGRRDGAEKNLKSEILNLKSLRFLCALCASAVKSKLP
jgi:hypothetical protein